MLATNTKNQYFAVQSNEIEGRIDPYFYKPEFRFLKDGLRKISHKLLGDIISFSKEIWNQKDVFDNKFPYIEISEIDITAGKVVNITYCDKKNAPSRAKMIVRENDIIVSTTRPHRGAIALIDKSKDGFIASTGFAVLRKLKTEDINKEYLLYFLRTNLALNQMLQRSSGGNYPAITAEELQKLIIPTPSLKTQNQIVEMMQSAYKQKAEKEAEAEKLLNSIDDYVLDDLGIKVPVIKDKKCFAVNSKDLENRRIDPKGHSEIARDILKAIKKAKYQQKPLSDLIEKSISGEWGEDVGKIKDKNDYVLAKVLRNTNFYNQGNLGFNEVAERMISKEKFEKVRLKRGDILIEKSGGSPIQPVGRVAIIEDEKSNFAFSNFLSAIRLKKQECLPEYLFCFLKALYSLNYMEYIQNQTTGIKNLIMEDFLSIPVSLPPMDKQKEIAKEYKSRMENAEQLKLEAENVIKEAKEKAESIILS